MILAALGMAWRSVKANKLRSGITIAIIALGIMALIGIITAIESMKESLRDNFKLLGSNSFSIRYKELNISFGNNSYEKVSTGRKIKKSNLNKPIIKNQVEYFKNNYHFPGSKTCISINGPRNQIIYYKNKKTNPQIRIVGGDENYLEIYGYDLAAGRNLNSADILSGRNICVLGNNIINKLFDNQPFKAVGSEIKIGSRSYIVVGVLKEKGSSAMLKQDDIILTTYPNAKNLNGLINNRSRNTYYTSYNLGVKVEDINLMPQAMDAATVLLRATRKLKPVELENFSLEKSDKLAELFIGFLSSITGAAGAIGFITLIGAAIGLMNIMLVTVNERNKEVGLIKAMGGKKKFIRNQFLFESILISFIGALIGIVLGIGLGNIFALALKTQFFIPWIWIIIGFVLCFLVGLFAGLYPAIKASRLNPIVVLRSE